MLSHEIREKFLKFFEKRGHTSIPSASLVPNKEDLSILFTTAGMQPLVPYLMGSPHPQGKRLVNIQKCVRTQDIEEVGDNTHDTFFEMLGNWSLGDYFKEEAIKWSYELLTSKEEGYGFDPSRLYVTIFEGDETSPRDEEAKKIWLSVGVPEHRIYFKGVADNWWPAVKDKSKDTWTGPTGPDTEMFYDITTEGLGDLTPEEFDQANDNQKVVEIWNDVFMQYEKQSGKIVGELKVKNVDTGAGLERLAMVLQGKNNIFDTDLFAPLIEVLSGEASSHPADEKAKRIIADHFRTSVFMIADGVTPSNTDRGYVLRRLLRRAYVQARKIGAGTEALNALVDRVVSHRSYQGLYQFHPETAGVVMQEIEKFKKALETGLKQVEKGADPFTLFTSYGLPLEIIEEVTVVDREKFLKQMAEHKQLSSLAGEQKFKNSSTPSTNSGQASSL